jgi:hypothetical protein
VNLFFKTSGTQHAAGIGFKTVSMNGKFIKKFKAGT